ncbi:Uncharacterised protein [uncultured Blautia sp.]|nr:Uncharacterised protein [uncultured Blautia sp.]
MSEPLGLSRKSGAVSHQILSDCSIFYAAVFYEIISGQERISSERIVS